MDTKILQNADLKSTKKRQLMLSVLENSKSALTAEDVYLLTSSTEKMNLSTVYRALNTMSQKSILFKFVKQDGKTYYQINNHLHKHSIICTICNRITPIDKCPLDMLEEKLTNETGFILTGHNLEFYGICKECAEKI